jgi:hypothetical protein
MPRYVPCRKKGLGTIYVICTICSVSVVHRDDNGFKTCGYRDYKLIPTRLMLNPYPLFATGTVCYPNPLPAGTGTVPIYIYIYIYIYGYNIFIPTRKNQSS